MSKNYSLFDVEELQQLDNETAKAEPAAKAKQLSQARTENLSILTDKNNKTEIKQEEMNQEEKIEKKTYTKDDVFQDVVNYFGGDELAAGVWIDKYALKDLEGNLLERTPVDMHHRLAAEFARIENKYANPMTEEQIFTFFDKFQYIVPQGSPMAGIGNNDQIVSLSNCFVIGNDQRSDSYGGIMKMDEEQVQLMKRRGGVGHDLSNIRPAGSNVKNCAQTSTGVVPFMERYSNSTREVAQDGRRGALMLSLSVAHPDADKFISAKLEQNKITGANISLRINDDFMNSVKNKTTFTQQYPIESTNPKVKYEIESKVLWDKIIHNAWASAEPGILFWDTIKRESIPDCYPEDGFATASTNPCGEIPLCPYDSCRLIALNLYGYVKNPFTDQAVFDMELFKEHVQCAQRLMDDIVDLEVEKIDKILEKIESDPEVEEVKRVEIELWNKIRNKTLKGRRTGLGTTAEGDMLAALGFQYGSDKGIAFSTEVHKQLALSAYRSSVTMARERGAFPIYSSINESENPFVMRLKEADVNMYNDMVRFGRRNISLLTIAPTGSVSICTQTTSGIEPAFNVVYSRRRKVNPNDLNRRETFTDSKGDLWEQYTVFHPKFLVWAEAQGYKKENLISMQTNDIEELVKKSPYHKATAPEIDFIKKVELQGSVQKWVDHSISVTVNMPNYVTEETVADVYLRAWEVGCKGITVYRDGSRGDAPIQNKEEEKKTPTKEKEIIVKKKRPRELEAQIVRFKNENEDWIAFVGINDGKPYEIFTGRTEEELFPIPKSIKTGLIVKEKNPKGQKQYNFVYFDKDGFSITMSGLSRCFNSEYWNYAKMISALLRNEIAVQNVVAIIEGMNFNEENINSWKNGVIRALKQFIQDGTKVSEKRCPMCEAENTLEYKEGCLTCSACGYSKCGS